MARAIVLVSRIALARAHQGADMVRDNSAHTLYGQVSNDQLDSPDKVNATDTLDGTPGKDTRTTQPREDDSIGVA